MTLAGRVPGCRGGSRTALMLLQAEACHPAFCRCMCVCDSAPSVRDATVRERCLCWYLHQSGSPGLVDPETLDPVEELSGCTLAALAVRIEGTRLIDNCTLEPTA